MVPLDEAQSRPGTVLDDHRHDVGLGPKDTEGGFADEALDRWMVGICRDDVKGDGGVGSRDRSSLGVARTGRSAACAYPAAVRGCGGATCDV